MYRSTWPIGLLGVISLAFHVSTSDRPQVRNVNFPNFIRKLRLRALSDGVFRLRLMLFGERIRLAELGMTSAAGGDDFYREGRLARFEGSMSPADSFFDLFCDALR